MNGLIWRRVTGAVVIAVAMVVQAMMLAPWVSGAGTPLDEGALLSYGDLVYRGYVPGRDLRTFYGPLNSYVLGAVLLLTRGNFYSERVLGLIYQLIMAASLLLLVRRRGPVVVTCATVLLLLMPPENIAATAARGACAALCVAVLLAGRGRPFAAALAGGVAIAMRYDWALPLALMSIPWLLAWSSRQRLRFLYGVLLSVAVVYLPYTAVLGPRNLGYALRLLHAGESGRRVSIPSLTEPAGALLWLMIAATGLLIAVGLVTRRTTEGREFLSVALMTVGLLPYATWSANRTHILTVAIPPIVMCAAAVPALLTILRPRTQPLRWQLLGVAGVIAVAPLAYQVVTSAAPPSTPLFPPRAFAVSNDGRTFLLDDPHQAAIAQDVVRRVDQIAPHGRVFVGPQNLTDAPYADAYMYYLLPRLEPGTFFIVLDRGTTELAPHRLSSELPGVDVLVLNGAENVVPASGLKIDRSDSGANQVVAREFCLRGRFGSFSVYVRCHPTSGAAFAR